MATKAITWDDSGTSIYELGTSKGVLYPQTDGAYPLGVAWNGLTAVTESPSGADETAIYASDRKYGSIRASEEFGGTIEAYTYPDEWAECDGSAQLAMGVSLGQQPRKKFGFCYKTILGNDVDGESHGYKLHLVYNSTASPSEKSYATINDSPDAVTFSWEFTSEKLTVPGFKPAATIIIDSTKVDATKLKALETILYGSDTAAARLPLPGEVITLMGANA